MSRLLLAGLLFCASTAYARKPAAVKDGFWLTSADHAYSIQFPFGWPYPGKSQSVSPPGMKHLFFLATKDDALAIDIAAGTKEMTPEQYLELVFSVQMGTEKKSAPVAAKLKDGSAFKYFKSVERQGAKQQHFLQGTLTKKDARYYVTVTSPKRHPNAKEWPQILAALASLRTGGSTVGGKRTPPLAGGASVVTIGPDGSSLRVERPYEVAPWGYTRKFGQPLHSYRNGPIRAEVALLGQARSGPREMATGLRAQYYKSAGAPAKNDESPVQAKRLPNAIEIFFYQIGLPGRDDDPRKQWMLEGFFTRKGRTYYYLAAAARDDLTKEQFEKASIASLDVLGRVEWPK